MIEDVRQAIEDLKAGKLVVIVDDDDREAEGDLVGLASLATGENVNFMTKHARGLICSPVSKEIAERLDLFPMIDVNTDPHGTAFTVSVDHSSNTTGISAFERARLSEHWLMIIQNQVTFKDPDICFRLLDVKEEF